ncbi:hypothetical protein OBBRIDRAFT_597318 [Obba rivulosa]|uniref:Uncharacterized protein n=1 Tax=Obba rivulosa TaxID=1052685 RepID=A0A8E2AYA5_9APHY|nr:hypothetical protein OBBRIDRAFT_597318 [Obba rivulosa]
MQECDATRSVACRYKYQCSLPERWLYSIAYIHSVMRTLIRSFLVVLVLGTVGFHTSAAASTASITAPATLSSSAALSSAASSTSSPGGLFKGQVHQQIAPGE